MLYNVAFQDNWTGLLISRNSDSEGGSPRLPELLHTHATCEKEKGMLGDVVDESI